MKLLKYFKHFFSKKKWETSFPDFKIDVPMPEVKPYSAQDVVIDQTKKCTTYQLVQEINRRKNNNHDGYEINFVIGKNTGDIHIGNQSGGKESICHACGLGRKCLDEDCPNTKIDDSNKWMFPQTVGYQPVDNNNFLIVPSGGSNVTKNQ